MAASKKKVVTTVLTGRDDPAQADDVLAGADKPVMIAARVHPRLQYGLRLLSRVQGGTIAEALEWAINLAMRQTRIGSGDGETRLNRIVDAVWARASEPQQIFLLHRDAPELLDFEQRAAWNLVNRCDDLWEKKSFTYKDSSNDEPPELVACEPGKGIPAHDALFIRYDVVEKHWPVIREVGILLGRAGEIEQRYTLDEILDGSALKRAGIDTPYEPPPAHKQPRTKRG